MKKRYEKPEVVYEEFELNENIAACETKVQFGPDKENSACGDYGFGDVAPFSISADITPFYDNSGCQCYYTAPEGSGYFGNS